MPDAQLHALGARRAGRLERFRNRHRSVTCRRCSRSRSSGRSSLPRRTAGSGSAAAPRCARRNSLRAAAGSRSTARPARSRPSAARSGGTKCGFGRKRTSKTRSASGGHAVLEPEAEDRDHERRAWRAAGPQSRNASPQLVDGQRVVSTHRVGQPADGCSARRSSRMPSVTERPRRERMRAPRLAESPRTSASSVASRKISTGLSRAHRAAALADTPGTRQRTGPRARRRRRRRARCSLPRAQRQLRERRQQRDRQVVDAEVAEVLERADRLGLARARQAREHDEPRRVAVRAAPARAAALAVIDPSSDVAWRPPSRSASGPSRRSSALDERRAPHDGPRLRSNWLRAATSTRIARFRPGATGMRDRAARARRASRSPSRSRPSRSYSRRRIPALELHDELDALRGRVAATPNRSCTLIRPRCRGSPCGAASAPGTCR